MPRRQAKTSSVKGPNSALTEFLRNEGITDAFRRRQEQAAQESETLSEGDNDTPSADISRNESVEPDDEEVAIRQAAREKRQRAGDVSDDEFSDEDVIPTKYGEPTQCCSCGNEFIISVYSPFINSKGGYLCENCTEIHKAEQRQSKKNQFAARKRRKQLASALLDKRNVQFPTLQDLCIKEITLHINQVDELGDIGVTNLAKICRILSKNRSLNDKTMPLFLNPSLKSIQFWDCSNVSLVSLSKIPAFCPNLEHLQLFMCGQLHKDNLEYFATNLPSLKSLALNGPFLIGAPAWQDYLKKIPPLESFELRNTHRFTDDNLVTLLECMGPKLTQLKLCRLDGIEKEDSYELVSNYCSKLTSLEIAYPNHEECVTDDTIIEILKANGNSLTELVLDGCTMLGDRVLLEGIGPHCPHLTKLSLRGLDLLTDEAMAEMFAGWTTGGLIDVDLTKCVSIGDQAVYGLWRNSGRTLVQLSLNSVSLSKEFLLEAFTSDSHPNKQEATKYHQVSLPLLTTLDVGFVRAVDDEVLSLITDVAPKLSILEVFGDNRVTQRVHFDNTLMIGRQLDEDL